MELEPEMHIPFLVLEQKCDPVKRPHTACSFLIQKMCLLPEGREPHKHCLQPEEDLEAAGGGGGGVLSRPLSPPPPAASWHQELSAEVNVILEQSLMIEKLVVMPRVTRLSSRLTSARAFVTVRNQLHS